MVVKHGTFKENNVHISSFEIKSYNFYYKKCITNDMVLKVIERDVSEKFLIFLKKWLNFYFRYIERLDEAR